MFKYVRALLPRAFFLPATVIMALMSLERDIEALTSVLEQISEVRDHNPNALDSEQVRAQVRQAIKITQQRRPLQKIFELRPVPWSLPYKQFFSSRMNAQHLSIMTRSLYSLTLLSAGSDSFDFRISTI